MSIGAENREELAKLLPPWDHDAFVALADKAGFTVQDMATWFQLDRTTVRCWLRTSVAPHPVKRKLLLERMALLERAIAEWPDKLPVPLQINRYQRTPYVKELLDHALKLPKSNSAKRRG